MTIRAATLLSALSLFTLTACGEPAAPTPDTSLPSVAEAPTNECVASAPPREITFAGGVYRIEAYAEGLTCEQATAMLQIISPSGNAAFETAYPTAQIPLAFNVTGADVARLSTELEAWTQNVAERPTADSLPAWPSDAAKPPYFTPALSREAYEAARAARRPLFCFPDGAESNACVAIDTQAQTAALLGSRTPERP